MCELHAGAYDRLLARKGRQQVVDSAHSNARNGYDTNEKAVNMSSEWTNKAIIRASVSIRRLHTHQLRGESTVKESASCREAQPI